MTLQAQNPRPDLLASKVNGSWNGYSTEQVHQMINQLSVSLLKSGISANDRTPEGSDKVGLISNGRPEWIITDLAVQQTGAILVPLYPTISLHELEMILHEAEIKILFVENKALYASIESVISKVPSLQGVFSFDEIEGIIRWTNLLKPYTSDDEEKLNEARDKVQEHDISTIIYTSGTTGRPKGVMLSHQNILSNVKACYSVVGDVPLKDKRAFSFLPLNHIFEKMISYCYLFNGFSIYYAENMTTIGPNLKEVKPDLFASVPRLLEKVFERIMAEGNKLKGFKRKVFYWAIRLAERYEINSSQGLLYKLQMRIADKLVFSKWRAAIGGNTKAIVVGGAACQVKLEKIFTAAKIIIMEGYGLTETSPVISVNHYPEKGRMLGTVGAIIDGVEVKISDDGEVLCKGPNVMKGYYKQPELTDEMITNGWFHTGDIGEMINNTFLKIYDRKKEIFKTAGGKYVAPLPIETKMKESPLIEQIIVIGPDRKFTSALIVPSFPNLNEWCNRNDVFFKSNQQVVKDKQVLEHYYSIINKFNEEFSHAEQIKKIIILPTEWSVEGGELTPKGSIRRKYIMEKYKPQIDDIYEEYMLEK